MSGTITMAAILRAGKAGTLPALLASSHPMPTAPMPNPDGLTYPVGDKSFPDPSPSPALPVLNANRNVIPENTPPASGGAVMSAAPMPSATMPAGTDWRAMLKKWWPWLLIAVLALAVTLRVSRPSGRRSSGE